MTQRLWPRLFFLDLGLEALSPDPDRGAADVWPDLDLELELASPRSAGIFNAVKQDIQANRLPRYGNSIAKTSRSVARPPVLFFWCVRDSP
jgi:hypothetical protein